MNKITINGKDYPCYRTMGAFLDYRKETGRDAATMTETTGMCDMIALVYSIVKSACRREKVDFPFTLEEFADSIMLDDLPMLVKALQGDDPEENDNQDGAKKKLPES